MPGLRSRLVRVPLQGVAARATLRPLQEVTPAGRPCLCFHRWRREEHVVLQQPWSASLRWRGFATKEDARSAEEAAKQASANAEETVKADTARAEEAAQTEAEKAEADASSKDSQASGSETKDEAKEPEGAEAAKSDEAAKAETPLSEQEVLERDLAELQDKVRAKKHELLMSLADFENNKKRFAKEREARRRRALVNFATKMTEVYSEFDAFAKPSSSGACKGLHEGVALTRDLYKASLEKFGAKALEAEIGEPLMPTRHESVGTVDNSELPENSVAELVRPGWLFEPDTVLRKAEVRVAKHGPEVPPAA